MKDLHGIVLGPHLTEKVSRLMESGSVFALKVRPNANKVEIRAAVETIWKVKVVSVRTQRHDGKLKRMGRFAGRRPSWKKAVVTLAPGQAVPGMS